MTDRRTFGEGQPEPDSGTPRTTVRPVAEGRALDPDARPQTTNSLGDTVMEIVKDLQGIVRGEVQLAKAELKEDATAAGKGAGMMGAGALIGLVGFIFLMLAATYALAQWMDDWLAALIVGAVLVIIAAILAVSGKNQIQSANLGPDKTIDSLKEDKEWASRQIRSVKN